MQLDTLDKRILYELDLNSRRPTSEIARAMRQGRDRIDYRIDRMLGEKIIKGFTTSVNMYRLGFTIYKTYLRLETSKTRVLEFVTYLRSHPRVYWLALCDGSWDLMIAVLAQTSQDFYRIHQEILSRFNEIVLNFGMYELVELDVYPKNYLVDKGKRAVLVGGEPGEISIDITDYEILKILSLDARTPAVQIAEKLDSTPALVKYRIERMEKHKIINGYRTEVDLRRLNMLFFKTQIFLRSYDAVLQQSLRHYCARNPHITYYIQQLGDCTIELEMEVRDYEHYTSIINEIRGEFARLVRNFQTVLIGGTRFNWVPQDLGNWFSASAKSA